MEQYNQQQFIGRLNNTQMPFAEDEVILLTEDVYLELRNPILRKIRNVTFKNLTIDFTDGNELTFEDCVFIDCKIKTRLTEKYTFTNIEIRN